MALAMGCVLFRSAEAVEFYRSVFSTLRDEGIEPFVNLFHFDMPAVLQERGGWESREVVDLYARYARYAFELFGDVVKRWYTSVSYTHLDVYKRQGRARADIHRAREPPHSGIPIQISLGLARLYSCGPVSYAYGKQGRNIRKIRMFRRAL